VYFSLSLNFKLKEFYFQIALRPSDDSVYVTGEYSGTRDMNGEIWNGGVKSSFFIQFYEDGVWGFMKNLNGSLTDVATRIAFDTGNNIYLAGQYTSNNLKFDGNIVLPSPSKTCSWLNIVQQETCCTFSHIQKQLLKLYLD
jgi:hypothetical protein